MTAQIDLKKVNATSFSFKVAPRVDEVIRKELEALLRKPLEEGKPSVLGTVHKKGDYEWVDIAILEYTEAVEPHLHVTFAYGLDDVPRPPRTVTKPYRLLEILSKSEELMTFICEASFLYKESAERSSIQLPIPVFRTARAGFNEITGVELSHTQPTGPEYEIRISVNQDKALEHEVVFNHDSRAMTRIGNELLRKAVYVSKQFLI